MRKIIKTNDLVLEDIPNGDYSWNQISDFALSFDPALELGTQDIYSYSRMSFDENANLIDLRVCLFLLQRWWNNRSEQIDVNGIGEAKKILELIKKKISEK